MNHSDSDSPLSSPPESEDEITIPVRPTTKLQKKAAASSKIKLKTLPAPPPRSPSPPPKTRKEEPHAYTFADSPELAFIVMFRSRFTDAFKGVPNIGCQDIERGVLETPPSEPVELLLCRLVSLVLNRKKPVERGHHNRALEEAVHAHQSEWPHQWSGKNPMPGGRSFTDLTPPGRLILLKALINWALVSSELIRSIIGDNYKGSRREDDLNVALSVQPWGRDGEKRRYWLIEGNDDTPFRLYRESNPALKNNTWWCIAGTINEIKKVAQDLEENDGTKHALALKQKVETAVFRFEEGEKKRAKREYRAIRKAMFNQPTGISLYEGRTRGKRIRYTFSDNEEEKESGTDDHPSRRSARSTRESPAPDVPRFTASGRQIRKPQTGTYGETKINGNRTDHSNAPSENGTINVVRPYDLEDDHLEAKDSGAEDGPDEWKGDSQGEDDDVDEDEGDDESEWDDTGFVATASEKKSLKITLKVNKDRPSRKGSVETENKDVSTNNGTDIEFSFNTDGTFVKTAGDVIAEDVSKVNASETLVNGRSAPHSPPALTTTTKVLNSRQRR